MMPPTRSRSSRTSSRIEHSTTGGSEMETRESTSTRRIRTETSSASASGSAATGSFSATAGSFSAGGDSGTAYRSSVTVTRSRSRSPLAIRREEEKKEIASLNDRLAEYIDYVRHMDSQNRELRRKYKSVSKVDTAEVEKLKGIFEDEMESLRGALDAEGKARAALEVENRKMKAEWEDMKGRLARKEMELRGLERKVEQFEKEVADARIERDRYASLKRDYDQEMRQNAEIKKALERESVLRAEYEAKVKNLEAKLEFQTNVYKEEKSKWFSRTIMMEEEVETQAKADYESKLAAELALMRARTEEDMRAYKLEIDGFFSAKFADLKTMSDAALTSASRAKDEVYTFRRRLDEVNGELAKKQAEIDALLLRVAEFERLLESERSDFEGQLRVYRDQNASLRIEMEKRFKEFNELMAIKVALDQEILAYRKLLESEETRCHLSHKERKVEISTAGRSSQQRLVDVDEEELDDVEMASTSTYGSAAEFSVKQSCSGPIEIIGCDGSGQFVSIKNTSDSDVVIGGWQLRYIADTNETLYKFPRNLTVKPGETCTVWSSQTHTTHEPPYNMVMKGLTFFTGDRIQISLLNKENEMAVCEMSRERRQTSSYSTSRRTFVHEERAGSEERCSVM